MLVEPLLAHGANQPGHVAVRDDTGTYTYRQLAGMSLAMASRLASATTRQTVGLMLPSSFAFAASFHGTLLAGKIVVPINFLLGEREIAHVIADSGIDTVVSIPLLSAKFKDAGLKVIDVGEWMREAACAPEPAAPVDPSTLPRKGADDLAVLMYTSGTSALPKGVMLTYGNLERDVQSAIRHAELKGSHRFLGVLPLFHSTGMLATLIAPVTLGSTVTYMARFSAVATVAAIREQEISIVAAVPSMYGAICRLKNAKPDDLKSLYAAISGGEPLPAAIRDGFAAKFGQPIYEGYGLTETIGPIAFNVPQAIRPGSVGRLIPGAEAKIVNDDGAACPSGQDGEIWLRGPMVMKGYHNLPKETADALTPDGYFKSGDLGHLDAEGYLHVTGRKKDLIIVAGEKAVPREIEEILRLHPAVDEAAVVGKKDASRGEVVVAFVTLKEGQEAKADALRDHCRSHGLPQWKIPREIFFEKELPHSPTGKVLKRVLSEKLQATA